MNVRPLIVVACLTATNAFAADTIWEVRGTFVSLKPGDASVAIIELPDQHRIEVPLAALAEEDRAAIAALAPVPVQQGEPGPVAVRGPHGRSIQLPVAEPLRGVETDAIFCRTAAEAADVYRLFLAVDGIAKQTRVLADARLTHWELLAQEGRVRLGDDWVPAARAQEATEEANRLVTHALELMRLGNLKLAEDDLKKASRVNPERGRADAVLGLAYALTAGNEIKAAEHFAESVRRQPNDPAMLNNLAVSELFARRSGNAVRHFRTALALAPGTPHIANNLAWAIRHATDRRLRIPDKNLAELNDLYRVVIQDLGIKPADTVDSYQLLAALNQPCAGQSAADVARAMEAHANTRGVRRAVGFVVAPGHVLCPSGLLGGDAAGETAEVVIVEPSKPSATLPAGVVATFDGHGLALVRCDGLQGAPLPLASDIASGQTITAVDRGDLSWFAARPVAVNGKILTAESGDAARRFIHSAAVPRGLGGGPIVDDMGHVVGVVGAAPETVASGQATSFGIPINAIRPLLKKHLPDMPDVVDAKTDLPRVESAVIDATVFLVSRPVQPPAPGQPQP